MFASLKELDGDLVKTCFDLVMTEVQNDYWHMHVTLKKHASLDSLLKEFKRFFELAHNDARKRFHDLAGITLDPLHGPPPEFTYPKDMPLKAKKGFFGEVLCAIFGYFYEIVEKKDWRIPVFLFRNHDDAADYLFRLRMGEKVGSDILGRRGNDFFAVELDNKGGVKAFLISEAKCHKNFNVSISSGVHRDLSNEVVVPVNVGRVREILAEVRPANWKEMYDSLGKILFATRPIGISRVDMFTYVFEDPKKKLYPPTRISNSRKDIAYSANRSLQAIEVFFPGCETFLTQLYDELYDGF